MTRIVFFLVLCLGWIFSAIIVLGQEIHFDDVPEVNSEDALPRVNLVVNIGQIKKDVLTKGLVEIREYTFSGEKTEKYNCSVKYRGASSYDQKKKSFALKIEDERGEKMDANLLGLRLENNWILDAMALDRLRMRNRVCFDVWNEISTTPYKTDFGNRNGTVGRFVELFINGNYHGLYCLTDKIEETSGVKKIQGAGKRRQYHSRRPVQRNRLDTGGGSAQL